MSEVKSPHIRGLTFFIFPIYPYIGVRDCPYGICCPWVRGGWDLDALGKFFRRLRRRRRRRPRLLLFRQILETSRHFQSFLMKNYILGHLVFRRSFFENVFELFSPLAGGSRVE